MVIVEGPDNSGKTTLARKLAADMELVYINNRQRPRGFKDLDYDAFHFCDVAKVFPTIFDRWGPISEPIYGRVIRDTQWPLKEELVQVHQYVAGLKPLVLYCRPSNKRILDFGDTEQMEGVKTKAKQLIKAYDKEMKFVNQYLTVCPYDYETHSYDQIRQIVQNHLRGPLH